MEGEQNPQKLEEAKNKFLASMSNEIQRSMKEVSKHSDLIKKTGLNDEQIKHVDTIYGNAHKLSWIVNDILDFFHLELGKVDLQSIDFNIEYLINDVFRKAVEQKKDRPVDTYIDIDKDVPRELIGDPTRLRQVLANLLSNAFKFTPQGEIGIVVHTRNRMISSAEDSPIFLRIIVKDSGIGIPRDRQEAVFDFHGRTDLSKSWEYGGTGLGLSLCKLVVESMGGTITLDSDEGRGSEFILTLPFKKGKSLQEKGIYPLSKQDLVGKKAIIVDDNEIARKILNKCCEMMGLEVQLISDSPRAVLRMLDDAYDSGDVPDVILCDIMMPEIDGYELARTIRANDRFQDIKLIAVTSAVRVGGARSAQESGFNGFLPKPVFLDELAKVIATVLGKQHGQGMIVTRHMVEEISSKNMKALVIEDGKADQELIGDCLNAMDCEGEIVINSRRAVECLKEKIYNVCLLDFDILKAEGEDTIRIIKEVSRNAPVVVLLTTDTKENRSQCLDVGADDFITKPIDMISLRRIIARYRES